MYSINAVGLLYTVLNDKMLLTVASDMRGYVVVALFGKRLIVNCWNNEPSLKQEDR